MSGAGPNPGADAAAPSGAPPAPSRFLLSLFAAYVERYLARHFHAVRLLGEPPSVAPGAALVVYLNHPSWWDPLIALLLARRLFAERRHHAPIDRAALERYRFFARLGFFGVDPVGVAGARRFLAAAEAILAQPGTALWVTPQGRFADPRRRPPSLRPGLERLARRAAAGRAGRPVVFLPLAIELPFWEERTPEALACFGRQVVVGGRSDAGRLPSVLAHRLVEAQDRLADAAMARDPADFVELLDGRTGVGGIYDSWRRLAARWRGAPFRPDHGSP